MPIRVFHCDDSPAFTTLTRHWLADHADLEHVGAAHSRDEALAALPAADPDVVLLDSMGMPSDSGWLRTIRALVPRARVIVYSGYVGLVEPDSILTGADAYLSKRDDEGALVALVRSTAGST